MHMMMMTPVIKETTEIKYGRSLDYMLDTLSSCVRRLRCRPRAENMTSDSANGVQRGFFCDKTYVVISHILELLKGFFIE